MFKKTKVIMLPTNEKSKLYLTHFGGEKLHYNNTPDNKEIDYQHLYFLSDELPQKNDKILCDERNHIKENPKYVIRTCKSIVNDWIMTFEIDGQGENPTWTKKIIATTDKSLTINSIYGIDSFDASIFSGSGKSKMIKLPQMFNLPQPSQSFIEKYVEEYNKGNVITGVIIMLALGRRVEEGPS